MADKATEMCTVFTKWRNKIKQIQVCMNDQYNKCHHKMYQCVPLNNQMNSTILGSAAIGIHFYGDISNDFEKMIVNTFCHVTMTKSIDKLSHSVHSTHV